MGVDLRRERCVPLELTPFSFSPAEPLPDLLLEFSTAQKKPPSIRQGPGEGNGGLLLFGHRAG